MAQGDAVTAEDRRTVRELLGGGQSLESGDHDGLCHGWSGLGQQCPSEPAFLGWRVQGA
jgi:hypothetical protein